MSYKAIIGVVTLILVLISYIPYIRDIILGKTKPHFFSWLIWFILTAVGFFIQISNGAGAGAWFNGLMIFICGYVMISGLVKGKKEIVPVDYVSLFLALIAVYFWLIIKEPTLSIILVIMADFFGYIPTLRKVYVHPYSETLVTYEINSFRLILALFALERFTFLTASYHIYMIIINILGISIMTWRRKVIS